MQHWVTKCNVAFCSVWCILWVSICIKEIDAGCFASDVFAEELKQQGIKTNHHSVFLGKLPELPNGSLQIHNPIGKSVRKMKMCNWRLLE